jgi:low temperature requirement protein LtrA
VVIAHLAEVLHGSDLLALAAGPGLYLVGSLVFKASVLHAQWRQRLLAVVAVFGITVSGAFIPALAAWSLVLVVLVALSLYETVELRRTATDAISAPEHANGGVAG